MENGCWEWQGTSCKGYGYFCINGKNWRAHRYSYEYYVGKIPEGLSIDHLCRNRACVNPEHLEPVTSKENTLRGIGLTAQNARKTHCYNGHLLDENNVAIRRNQRICKPCQVFNNRKQYLRMKREGFFVTGKWKNPKKP